MLTLGPSQVPPTVPRVLGLDEAGRGSVLGPLVVGGYLMDPDRISELAEAGVRDSKLLTARRRAELYDLLPKMGECHSVALDPARIDRAVGRHHLNHLEAEAFADLVRRTQPSRAFVDACDPVSARFGRQVARRAGVPEGRIVARHRADRDLPLVGAASIVAKVRRDAAIGELARELGRPIGSGYPSDPTTQEFLRSALAGGLERAPWLRRSWATTERLKPSPGTRTLESFRA